MIVRIIRTKGFDRDIKRIGATESDVEALILDLVADPDAGDRIVGLRGVRKVRFGLPSRRIGKSGGGRAIYLLVRQDELIILLLAFAKNERSDLSPRQRQDVLTFLKEFDNG